MIAKARLYRNTGKYMGIKRVVRLQRMRKKKGRLLICGNSALESVEKEEAKKAKALAIANQSTGK